MTKLSKKKRQETLARVNPSKYDKPITREINGESIQINFSNPQPKSWDRNNLIEKKNKKNHKAKKKINF